LRQALIADIFNDVINADLARDLLGPIRAAVIDDQDFHLVDSENLSRNIPYGLRQRFFFVETGDLDNQFCQWFAPKYPRIASIRRFSNLYSAFLRDYAAECNLFLSP
jgi:hypothetical protein